MPKLKYPHITIGEEKQPKNDHDVKELYTKHGHKVECMQRDTIQRIFDLWKNTNIDLLLIKDALGIKEYQNGDRDKQIKEARERIQEIGAKTEEADENIREDVNQLKIDVAVIKTAVLKEDQEKKRKWSFQEKIIIAILTAIGGPLLVLFIVFMIKTFIWHY